MYRLALLATLAALPALAQQPPRPAGPAPAPAAAPAPQPAPPATTPDRTTATFGDWVLRCEPRAEAPPTRQCELNQTLQDQRGQMLAQFAIGRAQPGAVLRFIALLPVNVTAGAPFRLLPQEGQPGIDVTLRACTQRGCMADAELDQAALARLRDREGPARLEIRDATGQVAGFPVSLRGLPAALGALAAQ